MLSEEGDDQPPDTEGLAMEETLHRVEKPARPVTLLHVSDPQFGRHHRFGNLALAASG